MELDRNYIRLIAITAEPSHSLRENLEWAHAVVRGGATMLQLRAKRTPTAKMVDLAQALVSALSVPVIVNDRADVAIIAGAAGVHLGNEDLPVERVRSFAPAGFIIGASVGSDEELAFARGADYVGVGPVFATPSKPDAGAAIGTAEMARLIRASGLPGAGIGGITSANAAEAVQAGADGIAVLSSLADEPERAARALAAAIGI